MADNVKLNATKLIFPKNKIISGLKNEIIALSVFQNSLTPWATYVCLYQALYQWGGVKELASEKQVA